MTSRDAPTPALGDGWIGVLAMTFSRAYLIFLATLAAIVVIPGALGWATSVVQSDSMAPHVNTGDVILSTPLKTSAAIPVGGVVTFDINDHTVVHRIVKLNEDNTIVTAGDANAEFDPWSLTRDDITGQARLLVPYVGLPGMWLQKENYVPLVSWIAITLAAVVFAVPRSGPTDGGSRRHRGGKPVPTSVRVGAGLVVTTLATAGFIGAPLSPVDAVFTGSSTTSASWKAQSYSPITVGSMSGFGAIASNYILDTSLLFYQSTIYGNAATTPGTSIVGFRDRDIETAHTNDRAAQNAMAAARTVRSALEQRPVTQTLPEALGGTTLGGGVYASSTGAFSLAGTLTLDAKGDPSARFVFRTTSTLTMEQRSQVVLANGAQAANVWWLVGTSATLGTSLALLFPDTFAVGNYLVGTDVTMRGATLSGRVVAFDGAILMNGHIAPPN